MPDKLRKHSEKGCPSRPYAALPFSLFACLLACLLGATHAGAGPSKIDRARTLFAAKKYAPALKEVSAYIDREGVLLDGTARCKARLLKALALKALNRRSEALSVLQEAAQDDPENLEVPDLALKMETGQDLESQTDDLTDEVEGALKTVFKWVRKKRATSRRGREAIEPATKTFQRAVKAGSALGPAHLGLGVVLTIRKATRPDAMKHLLASRKADPKDPRVHRALARLHAKSGRREAAIGALRDAFENGHADGRICASLAMVLARRGRSEDLDLAIRALAKAARARPEDARRAIRSFRKASWRKPARKAMKQAMNATEDELDSMYETVSGAPSTSSYSRSSSSRKSSKRRGSSRSSSGFRRGVPDSVRKRDRKFMQKIRRGNASRRRMGRAKSSDDY